MMRASGDTQHTLERVEDTNMSQSVVVMFSGPAGSGALLDCSELRRRQLELSVSPLLGSLLQRVHAASLAGSTRWMFCYTIIERKQPHVLPVVRSSAGGGQRGHQHQPSGQLLPLRPYLLHRSVLVCVLWWDHCYYTSGICRPFFHKQDENMCVCVCVCRSSQLIEPLYQVWEELPGHRAAPPHNRTTGLQHTLRNTSR
ncbi:hypothetical protein KUCAC02_007792 [Chaenocephalus aceratus]|uniref:Uncharacterized protein n=1 Tax=Chaenocephalus aceratus TaxID=36190 RepID=A0ACB9X6H5_CHAAC|nr:hypothetical protein KUCAC02_007792 [Chaenocephalus aceratus]